MQAALCSAAVSEFGLIFISLYTVFILYKVTLKCGH